MERPVHTAGMLFAVAIGFIASTREFATPQFEQLTRALDITGPLISLLSMLSMLYNVATTLAVMAVAYALVCLMWQYIASRRRVS